MDHNAPKLSSEEYKAALYECQVELVKLQRKLIAEGQRVLIIVEGRDAAGKDGLIKRLIAHMSPRETRVFAVGVPSEKERTSWYFQRFVPHLPAGGEFVVFNRSWYNRAGVERVMGFCTHEEYEHFMLTVPTFETLLVQAGITVFKYYLDISRSEQKKRLAARVDDPLKQWKVSPVDKVAQKKWEDYSEARDEMFRRTHHPSAPWHIVRSDTKKNARVALISDLLSRMDYPHKHAKACTPDPRTVFPYSEEAFGKGLIAP
ncbi:MAG: polyphosphate kinase 2 [Alphaproteobacteria bacterium]